MELIKKLHNVAITTVQLLLLLLFAVLDSATAAREMELNKKLCSRY